MKKTLIILFTMLFLCGTLLYAADKEKVEREVIFNDVSPISNSNYIVPLNRDVWDILYYFSDTDAGNPGLETNGTHIFTTEWRTGYVTFHKFDMTGTFIEEFDIAGATCIRDMAYDGTYFYGSAASMSIFIMDLEAQTLIGTIPVSCAGVTGVRHIAYDPELDGGNGGFWIGNWDELGAITMSGAQIYGNISPAVVSLYGNAYDPWTTGGPYLWLFSQTGGCVLHQFEIATQTFTGVTHDASDIPGFNAAIAGGAATYVDANGIFVLLVNLQQDPNLIGAYELAITADPLAPGLPTGVVVTPDAGGVLEADIDWICPTDQVNGDPLTDLDEMRVYRDDVLIYTDSAPVIGGPGNYTDVAVPLPGNYTYKVVGYNDFDEGLPVTESVWVGEDVPNVVENLLLEQSAPGVLSGTLTWDNPTTGLNGGAFNEPILGYHIVRYPDIVTFEPTGTATSYVDPTISVVGVYWYTVQAYNSTGDGGTETSNAVLIADPGLLIMEDFTGGVPPAGWYVDGLGQGNWSSQTTTNAGGTSPELRFSWSPSFIGVSRMCTMPVNTVGFNELSLEFKHNVNDYAGSGYSLGVATTSDGTTWNTAWEIFPTTSVPATTETIVINTPDVGSATFQMAFFLDGDSYQINYWYIDDVLLVTLEHGDVAGVVTDDVTALPIDGAEVWIEGYPSSFTNPAGEYLLESITTGMRDIFAIKDGYYNYQGVVEVLPDVVVTYDINMDPALLGILDGTVTDADTGAPLIGAEIFAISLAGYEYNEVTNNSGYYFIEDMVAELYDVFCSFPNYPTEVVEDVLIEDGLTTTVDFEMEGYAYWCDFENSDGGLISDNPNGWQWGIPANGPASAYSGVKLWGTVLSADYPSNANYKLDTPVPFSIVSPLAALKFWHWYDIESYWDGGNIKVSADGGTSWDIIFPDGGYPEDAASTANAGIPGEPCYSGTQATWTLTYFDLSGYIGQSIIIRWHFGSDGSINYPGWFIDDVSVSGAEIPDPGYLEGTVTEFGTGIPIEGAVVSIEGTGLSAITLADGTYDIQDIWPGDYDIICIAPLYLAAEELGYSIVEGLNTLDFSLLWSEIAVDVTELTSYLPPDETEVQTFTITNDGPGELEYDITFEYPVEVNVRTFAPVSITSTPRVITKDKAYDETAMEYSPLVSHVTGNLTDAIWDIQGSFRPIDASGGIVSQAGMEFDGTHFFCPVWNSADICKYDIDGIFVETFQVPGVSATRDLAYDGQYMYGGSSGSQIYCWDPVTYTLITTINSSQGLYRAIAYDSDNDGFLGNNWSGQIVCTARDGSTLYIIPDPGFTAVYGLAYDNISDGGPYLWIFDQMGSGAEIHQLDIASGSLTGVMRNVLADFPSAGIAGGLWKSTDYVAGTLTLGGLVQGEDAFMYELCETENWVMVTNNISGTVPANGGTIVVEVTFDTAELLMGDVLTADLLIHNNSNYTRGDDYVIPVTLTVSGNIPPSNLYVDEETGLCTWDAPPGPTDSGDESKGQRTKNDNDNLRDLLGYNVYLDTWEDPIGTTTGTEWQYEDLVVNQDYVAGVSAVYDDGESEIMEYPFTYIGSDAGDIIPLVTELRGNFPNPFNPDTQIAFSLNKQSHVQITIYNIRGQLVRTLVDEQRDANNYTVTWNGTDDSRKPVSSGIYFYKMKAEKYVSTKKMILMK